MKTLSLINNILIIVASIILSCELQANDRIHYIRHFDYAKPSSAQYSNASLPKKTNRVSSTKGEINLLFYTDIPDSIKTAILVAKELWETRLHNKKPIYIEVSFESLEEGTAMYTETGIMEENGNFIPLALSSQSRDQRDDYDEAPDGYIGLNSDMNWNCSFLNENKTSYNVTTMMLRGIARCLGFVSSMQQASNNTLYFYDFVPTVFDCHLYNGSSSITNINNFSQNLTEFATSDNVFFRDDATAYPIYSPKEYIQGESLCYLKDLNSLMSHSLGKGNVFLDIDYATLDILNTLGWNLPSESLKIKCEDFDESGVGSCYKSHTFTLVDNNLNISKYQWSFSLKNKEGKYEIISLGNTKEFTVNSIKNPNNYYANTNGDLEGRIECDYYVDGMECNAEPYHVSLEQKPRIISVSTPTRTWNKYNFSLEFNVNYTGADKIEIRIEEEYDYNMLVLRVDEPIIAHVKTGLISGLYYSWVTIVASNSYGSTRKTLEFAPFFDDEYSVNTTASIDLMYDREEDSRITVFNLQGLLLFEGSASDFQEESLTSGIYIKKTSLRSGKSITSKILIP